MKPKSNHLMLVIASLLFWGLIASCNPQEVMDTPEITNTPVSTATPTLVPTPSTDEIREIIVNALLALYTQSNRMEVTTVPRNGQAQTNMIEFVPPDRKHIVSVAEDVEYIVVENRVYAKTGGKWAETQIPAASFFEEEQATALTIEATISEVQYVREDTLEGKAVVVYSYTSTTKANDIELHSQTELWVGAKDGLPYKMVIDGEILSLSTDPNTGENKFQTVQALTTSLVEFDPTIKIEAPTE